MLKTPDFMSRDFEMCKKCINDGAVTYENAIRLNRMVCMLFAGYFKKVLDEGIEEYQIGERVDQFIKDVDTIVKMCIRDRTCAGTQLFWHGRRADAGGCRASWRRV